MEEENIDSENEITQVEIFEKENARLELLSTIDTGMKLNDFILTLPKSNMKYGVGLTYNRVIRVLIAEEILKAEDEIEPRYAKLTQKKVKYLHNLVKTQTNSVLLKKLVDAAMEGFVDNDNVPTTTISNKKCTKNPSLHVLNP